MNGFKDKIEGGVKLGRRAYAKKVGWKNPDKFIRYLKDPIFVIGCGRSGTSMLTRILESHQDICNYSEANDIWDPLGYPWYSSDLDRPPIWYDTEKYMSVWRDYFDSDYEKRLKGIFGCFQHLSKTDFFLNKSPMNTLRIPEIRRMFPESKIINIVRDGRAVAYSWAVKQRKKIDEHEEIFRKRKYDYDLNDLVIFCFKSWIYHMEQVEICKKEVGLLDEGNFMELSYSDFSASPGRYLERIGEFLKMGKDAFKEIDTSHVGNFNFKWSKNLDDTVIKEMDDIISSYEGDINIESFLSD